MISISLKNSRNQVVMFPDDDTQFQLVSVSGLDPVQANLNLSNVVGVDGSRFISSKLTNRNIVILVQVNGDAEENRRRLYGRFPPKEKVHIIITEVNRDVYIDGIVESLSCNVFQNGMKAQISIICPDPYFKSKNDATEVDAEPDWRTGTVDFTFKYDGEAPAYLKAVLQFNNYITLLRLEGPDGKLEFNYNMTDIDRITIDCEAKTAILRKTDTTEINLIPFMTADSEFIRIPVGTSHLVMTVNPNLPPFGASMRYRPLYGGI